MTKRCPWIVQVQIWDEFGKLVCNMSRYSSWFFRATVYCKTPLSVQHRLKAAFPVCSEPAMSSHHPHLSCSKQNSMVCSMLNVNTSICIPMCPCCHNVNLFYKLHWLKITFFFIFFKIFFYYFFMSCALFPSVSSIG